MRVIAGKYRGRSLAAPKDFSVRPTTDRVKENLFNILQFKIDGARVLDLFAGSGALGIEAVSRGADEVWFVDGSRDSAELIRKNLSGIEYKGGVLNKDFADALKNLDSPFDVIFIDPPYKKGLADKAVEIITERGLLSDKGVIVCEHGADEICLVPEGCTLQSRRKYGDTALSFIGRA